MSDVSGQEEPISNGRIFSPFTSDVSYSGRVLRRIASNARRKPVW
jgi:hypothetical protein